MFAGRVRLILVLLVWLATAAAMVLWLSSGNLVRVVVGGGPEGSETFELTQAIADTLNTADGNFRLDVYETGGTTENLELLLTGQVDVATVQADTAIPEGISGLARLYHDAYHLIVAEESAIYGFEDLPGHRVAIPPSTSGQHNSFWFLADHYGVPEDAFIALPMDEAAANFAMIHGQVDAVFRVRAPGNRVIRELVRDHSMRLVPVSQADALALRQPAIGAGVIPLGSYRGSPPLPVRDLNTAVLNRLLVTRDDLAADTAYQITRGLFELRSDLVARNQLAGLIRPLDSDAESVVPAHPGARRYYDREKPGLFQENARLASAGLYVLVILSSALFALRSRWVKMRRVRMGEFNERLMEIAGQVREEGDYEVLLKKKYELMDMLGEVVNDLDSDRVNQEEFEHFSFTWQAVDALVRDRLVLIREPAPMGASA